MPFPFFCVITYHVIIFRHIGHRWIVKQFIFLQHFLNSSIGKQRTPVTDTGNLFQMRTDIEKRKTFFHIMADDTMKFFQFIITDKSSYLIQHDQMISHDHCTEQLHNDPLKSREPFHIFVQRNIHSNIIKKWLHLLIQDFGPDHPLVKARSQHKNIICNIQIPYQGAFFLNNTDPVCRLVMLFPGIYFLPAIIDVAVIERQVSFQKLQKSCFSMAVYRKEAHNFPLKDLKVKILQFHNLILFVSYTLHSENFISHASTLLFFTCLSSVSTGIVISTSVPSPGTE